MGRPSLPPGRYFRLLLVGYFEGLDCERGMAWRAADSLAVRTFVGRDLDTAAPDHSTISRTRRLIDVETLYRGGDRPLVGAVSRGEEADWPGGRRSGERAEVLRTAVPSTTGPLCGLRSAPPTLHAGFRPSPEWSTDEPIVSKTHQF